MRYTIVAIFLAMNPLCVVAQKNNTFADAGFSLDDNIPGASVTYNRKLIKYFGVGVGGQAYKYSRTWPSGSVDKTFTPALFADLRGYLPIKKSLLFLMCDFGVDFYKSEDVAYAEKGHNNGFYTGLGLGYCYEITKRRSGPYMSVKIVSDAFKNQQYNIVTKEVHDVTNVNATSVISVGYKF